MAWNSLPDFIRDPTSSTDCFRRLYSKHTCSRVTSASSALWVLTTMRYTNPLTHSLTHSPTLIRRCARRQIAERVGGQWLVSLPVIRVHSTAGHWLALSRSACVVSISAITHAPAHLEHTSKTSPVQVMVCSLEMIVWMGSTVATGIPWEWESGSNLETGMGRSGNERRWEWEWSLFLLEKFPRFLLFRYSTVADITFWRMIEEVAYFIWFSKYCEWYFYVLKLMFNDWCPVARLSSPMLVELWLPAVLVGKVQQSVVSIRLFPPYLLSKLTSDLHFRCMFGSWAESESLKLGR